MGKVSKLSSLVSVLSIAYFLQGTIYAASNLSLEEMLEQALKKSIPALINKHKLKKAEKGQRNDFYAFFPTLDFEAGRGLGYSLDEESENFVSNSANSISLNLSIPIFAGGDRFYQLKDGKLALKQTKIDTLNTISGFIIDLIKMYFDFHLVLAQLKITDYKLENVQTALEKAKQLVSLGIKTEIDVYDREIELAQIKRSILELNNSKKNILSKIKNYINTKKQIDFNPINIEVYKPYYYDLFNDNFSMFSSRGKKHLIENNLSIKSWRITLERSKLKYIEIKKKRWPKANISASLTRDYSRYANKLDEGIVKRPVDSANLRAGLTWDLWDNYSIERDISVAASNYEIDSLNFEKEQRQIHQDLNEHLQNYKLLEQSIDISILALEKSEKQYSFAKEMYDLGKIPVSTLAVATETWFRSKLQVIELKSEKLVLMARILKTLGYNLFPASEKRKATQE